MENRILKFIDKFCEERKIYNDKVKIELFKLCVDEYNYNLNNGLDNEQAFIELTKNIEIKLNILVKQKKNKYSIAYRISLLMLLMSLFEFFLSSIAIASLGLYVIESIIVFLLLLIFLLYLLLTMKKRKWYDFVVVSIFLGLYLLSTFIFLPSGFLGGHPKEKYIGILYFPGIIKEFTILFTENGCQGFIENINVTHRFSPNFIVSFIMVIILYLKNKKNK